jgi:hypothetical protein
VSTREPGAALRHRLGVELCVAIFAVAGAQSYVAIVEWVADLSDHGAAALGLERRCRVSPRSAGWCSGSTATGPTPHDYTAPPVQIGPTYCWPSYS